MRVFDIILSAFLLVILSPVFILVALLLKFTGEGHIFYLQERIGYKQHTFKVFKFATMLRDSPNIGAGTLTLKNDSRVLPVGRFLRASKLNELPQIVNVLLGQMALVGPRPLVMSGERNYSEQNAMIIRSVRPGITGIGSIVFRDEESFYAHRSDAHQFYSLVIAPYKEKLEVWYAYNRNVFLDMKIVIFTALLIFFPSIDIFLFFRGLPKMPDALKESKMQRVKK